MIRPEAIFLVLFVIVSTAFGQSIPQEMQQGLARYEAGNLEEAETLFKGILEENPQHGPASLMLGQIYLQRGQLENSEVHLKVATTSNPQRIYLAWQLLGKVHLLRKDYPAAQAALQRSQVLSPGDSTELFETKLLLECLKEDPDVLNRLKITVGENLGKSEAYSAWGMFLIRKGDSKATMPFFEIAAELNPKNSIARFFLQQKTISKESEVLTRVKLISDANNSLKEGNFENADRIAKEILLQNQKYVPAHLILIEAAEKAGRYWDALTEYRLLLQWLPGVPAIESRQAILARDVGAYSLAECSTRNALRSQPSDGSLYYLLGTILAKEERTDEAIEACKKAIELGFNQAEVYIVLGNLYYDKMLISESIATLGKAVELDPRAAESIASVALSALTTENYKSLRALLEKDVEAHPDNVNTLYSLGLMYSNEGKTDRAEDYFLRLLKLKPEYSQVHYNLALIYAREGDQAKASDAMAKFQELKAKEQKDWLKYSDAHKTRHEAVEVAKNQPARALELYQKLYENGTADKQDLLAAAKSCKSIRDDSCAFHWYERVLKIAPYDKEAIEGLASAAEALGKSDVAALHRSRAQLLSPSC